MNNETSSNNKRIAQNTLLLYFRMLFTMIVTLYTSRVILQVLGIEDFGIYNVVAGVVSFMGFINGCMSTTTSRYITFSLGKGNKKEVNEVFNTAFHIHAIIALIVIILSETIGIWFIEYKLNVPPEKIVDAHIVFQFTLANIFLNILTVPYSALIVAHEKMSIYAYITIVDIVIKLLIVFLLQVFSENRLIYYGLFLMLSQILQNITYHYYCRKNYEESTLRKTIASRSLFKEMLSFASWSMFTNLSGLMSTQGLNILLNLFFGPTVNASRGIAVQVQGAVNRFCVNIQTAFNPQITKSYASNEWNYTRQLILNSSRFSFFLLLFLSVGLLTETPYIIQLWLGSVPDHVCVFVQWMLCTSMIEALCNPIGTTLLATGHIKIYQSTVGLLILSIVPISWYFLRLGYDSSVVFVIHFIVTIMALIVRLYLVHKYIKLTYESYFKKCICPIITVTLLLFFVILIYYKNTTFHAILNIVFCLVTSLIIIYSIGLTKNERFFVKQKCTKLLHL